MQEVGVYELDFEVIGYKPCVSPKQHDVLIYCPHKLVLRYGSGAMKYINRSLYNLALLKQLLCLAV